MLLEQCSFNDTQLFSFAQYATLPSLKVTINIGLRSLYSCTKKSFSKAFALAETVVVKNATFTDGLLRIDLEEILPEEKKAKKIDILDPFGVQEATKQLLTESVKQWSDFVGAGTKTDTK